MANATKVPNYIIKEATALRNALNDVAKHADNISNWVSERTDYDGSDFFNEYELDNPYEFDIDDVISALRDMVQEQD